MILAREPLMAVTLESGKELKVYCAIRPERRRRKRLESGKELKENAPIRLSHESPYTSLESGKELKGVSAATI